MLHRVLEDILLEASYYVSAHIVVLASQGALKSNDKVNIWVCHYYFVQLISGVVMNNQSII